MKTGTKGVVLMNLGSPNTTSVRDVRRYLNEFLMDRRVIDTPYLMRLLLVRGIIVPFRAPKSAHAYQSIWTPEGSPLIALTKQLQNALQREVDIPVEIAMRYGSPNPAVAYDRLSAKLPELDEVILIPLYPQYAMSSYETAMVYAQELHGKRRYPFRLTLIGPWYNEPHYVEALSESISPYLNQGYDHLLFSYHGVPERHIHKGDITGHHCLVSGDCCDTPSSAHDFCYRHQCLKTTALVTKHLAIPLAQYSVAFQSRLGRDEWLKPYTAERLMQMPSEGIRRLLVVCPAFVSDCLETLEEIAMQGKDLFMNAGGTEYTVIPCLNSHPLWVKTLAMYIQRTLQGDTGLVFENSG